MKKCLLLLLILIPILGFCVTNSYVCPNTYQTIQLGYSSSQVANACGQPANTATQQTIGSQPVEYQQWVYTSSGQVGPTNANSQYGPQLLVTFLNNKVTQISVTNQVNTQSFPCYSMNRIQVGTSSDRVLLQCGQPRFVNNVQQAVSVPVTVTTWTYNFGSYKPMMIFTFENDKLSNIQMGQLAP